MTSKSVLYDYHKIRTEYPAWTLVAFSDDALQKAIQDYDLPKSVSDTSGYLAMTTFVREGRRGLNILEINLKNVIELKAREQDATIVHECVHVVQNILDHVGFQSWATEPEIPAYLVDYHTEAVMLLFDDAKKEFLNAPSVLKVKKVPARRKRST